jgi:hypothetical protein
MKMFARSKAATPLAVLLLPFLACSSDERQAYARAAEERGVTIVDPAATPYTPVNVAASGSLTGSVHFTGSAPVDTAITITRDERICGNTLRHVTVETEGDRVGGAIVWISDIRSGRPLPLARRFELVQTRCTYGPLVQVVNTGGTLNVRTHDPVVVRSVVVDTRSLDTLATLPFNSSGSLIPLNAQLSRPAMLEVRSLTHPWMQAWVAVLDHPYHATTDRGGAFSMDGVPPGQYQVRAWHPRFGMARGSATVQTGAATQISLTFEPESNRDLAAATRQAAAASPAGAGAP